MRDRGTGGVWDHEVPLGSNVVLEEEMGKRGKKSEATTVKKIYRINQKLEN